MVTVPPCANTALLKNTKPCQTPQHFHQLGQSQSHRVCLSVCVSVCLSPSHATFSEASHWSSDHMTRSRPLIGQPSLPTIWWWWWWWWCGWRGRGGETETETETETQTETETETPQIFLTVFLRDNSHNLFKFVSVLLSASVERVGVSRMRDFFCLKNK